MLASKASQRKILPPVPGVLVSHARCCGAGKQPGFGAKLHAAGAASRGRSPGSGGGSPAGSALGSSGSRRGLGAGSGGSMRGLFGTFGFAFMLAAFPILLALDCFSFPRRPSHGGICGTLQNKPVEKNARKSPAFRRRNSGAAIRFLDHQ